jgi:ADP-ribosyl-[dinitrogen reductase] hydrolase
MTMEDRKRGCFYGLAIGDALGAAIEFQMPGTFVPVAGYRDGGPHGLDAGQWTDDTSMALALADSIGKKGWDTKDQLERYLDWFQNGKYSVNGTCFDIGGTTRYALNQFEQTGSVVSDDDQAGSGNGSIMRLAPVTIKYCDDDNFVEYLKESSITTHASPQCVDGCIALGKIVGKLLEGRTRPFSLDVIMGQRLHPLIQKVIDGSYKTNKNIKGSGWVVASLEAALWAFSSSDSFEECVLKAVNLGEDADTTGAVAGQLAGAYWGYSGIPQKFIDGLDRKDMIDEALVSLGLQG